MRSGAAHRQQIFSDFFKKFSATPTAAFPRISGNWELIHEEFGDGIMSAVSIRFDVKRIPGPAGDRVVVTPDGKFLPYQW